MKQQALHRNGRVVHRLCGNFPLTVALQTAVAVNTVADAVEEIAAHAVYIHGRQPLQIPVNGLRRVTGLSADVGEKIVAAAGGKVVDMAADLELGGVVDEAVQRSVSSGDHNPVIVPEGTKEGSVIIDFRDIAEQQTVTN